MKIINFINRHEKKIIPILAGISVLLLSIIFLLLIYPQSTIEGHVLAKRGSGWERNTNQGQIVIERTNGETMTLANQDNLLLGKNNEVKHFQQDLTIGKSYSFKLVGISLEILGVHPNILQYKLTEKID